MCGAGLKPSQKVFGYPSVTDLPLFFPGRSVLLECGVHSWIIVLITPSPLSSQNGTFWHFRGLDSGEEASSTIPAWVLYVLWLKHMCLQQRVLAFSYGGHPSELNSNTLCCFGDLKGLSIFLLSPYSKKVGTFLCCSSVAILSLVHHLPNNDLETSY